MWQAIIEKYTVPGETILDPMSGVGSTLIAALMGRNVICVEMEQHFVEPMRASWDKMRQHPMLGFEIGTALILRGDARHLPLSSADHIVTSPPYEAAVNAHDENPGARSKKTWRRTKSTTTGHGIREGYTRPVDVVVSSPPYEGSKVGQTEEQLEAQRQRFIHAAETDPSVTDRGRAYARSGKWAGNFATQGYTRPVDAVVSSPPYEGSLHEGQAGPGATSDDGAWAEGREVTRAAYTEMVSHCASPVTIRNTVGSQSENIGNLKANAYWSEISKTYQECHRVLKPGGIMALVLKGFTRDGKYVDLPGQTRELVENVHRVLYCSCENPRLDIQQEPQMPDMPGSDHEQSDVLQGPLSASLGTRTQPTTQRGNEGDSQSQTITTDVHTRATTEAAGQPTDSNGEAAQAAGNLPDVRQDIEPPPGCEPLSPMLLQDQRTSAAIKRGGEGQVPLNVGSDAERSSVDTGGESQLEGGSDSPDSDTDRTCKLEATASPSIREGQLSMRELQDNNSASSPSHDILDERSADGRVAEPPNSLSTLPQQGTQQSEGSTCLVCNRPYLPDEKLSKIGFVHFDTWYRELWNLSFWRTLQQRRDPDAFDERLRYETVLAFRKGGVTP